MTYMGVTMKGACLDVAALEEDSEEVGVGSGEDDGGEC